MRRIKWSMVAVLGFFVLSSARSYAADPPTGPQAQRVYLKNCASCHGKDGTGTGPVSQHMSTKPTNLTLLAKNNGGEFPYERVLQVILLQINVPAHGYQDMPVWGDGLSVLDQIGPTGGGAGDRGKSEALTQYIQSIQQK